MNRKLPILTVTLLVLLAGCAGTLQTDTPTTGSDSDQATTIAVSGTGEITADADLAILSLSVVATADTADAARAQVARDADRLRAALSDAGIPDDAITTVNYRISPQYDYSEKERTVTGYQAIHAFRVETSPDRAGDLIDVAVANGTSQVDNVRFTLSDETRAELRAQALEHAVDDARADADVLTAQTGLGVTGVQSVGTNDGSSPVYHFAESGGVAKADGTTLSPGPITVTATVQVTYTAA